MDKGRSGLHKNGVLICLDKEVGVLRRIIDVYPEETRSRREDGQETTIFKVCGSRLALPYWLWRSGRVA